MKSIGLEVELFKYDFFNEFPVSFNKHGVKYSLVHEELLKRDIHGGLYIGNYYPELGETALYAFTELHFKEDIDLLVNTLSEILSKR